MSRTVFEGPIGPLEGLLESHETNRGAVLCHPHPLYGGSMDDMVLQAVNNSLTNQGFSSLRFNFRGVGASEGSHDKGEGEVDDVTAAASLMRGQGAEQLLLAGYSFGAAMCLKAALEVKPDYMLLVAPPVQMMAGLPKPEVPSLVILGSDDQIVAADHAIEWFSESEVAVIEGADHFFFGAHGEIENIVATKGLELWS